MSTNLVGEVVQVRMTGEENFKTTVTGGET